MTARVRARSAGERRPRTPPDYRGLVVGQVLSAEVRESLRFCCATWGSNPPPHVEHMDCVVVVTDAAGCEGSRQQYAGTLPHVCACDCLVCKRAWWADGRPMLGAAGEIVRSDNK